MVRKGLKSWKCILTYNGEIYNIAWNFIAPKKYLSFVSNHVKGNRRINNRFYDINTISYKNLITNKDAEIVQFYKKQEDYVLRKDSKIIRNYLKRGVTFKLGRRIMEVMIKKRTSYYILKRCKTI